MGFLWDLHNREKRARSWHMLRGLRTATSVCTAGRGSWNIGWRRWRLVPHLQQLSAYGRFEFRTVSRYLDLATLVPWVPQIPRTKERQMRRTDPVDAERPNPPHRSVVRRIAVSRWLLSDSLQGCVLSMLGDPLLTWRRRESGMNSLVDDLVGGFSHSSVRSVSVEFEG